MRLAIITNYPISKDALGDYAFRLVKQFRQHDAITELILLTNKPFGKCGMFFVESGCKIYVKPCWISNSLSNVFNINKAIKESKPDAVLFDFQETVFGDNKIANALLMFLPFLCRLKKITNVAIWHQVYDENKFHSTTKFLVRQLNKVMQFADGIVVTEDSHEQLLKEKYNAKNIILVSHNINIPEVFKVSQQTKLNQISNFGDIIEYDALEELSRETKDWSSINKVVDVCVNMFHEIAERKAYLYDKKMKSFVFETR